MDCITGTAVLEFDPAETLSPVGAISLAYPRLCRPHHLPWPAHPRGKPRLSTSTRYFCERPDCPLEGAGFEPSVPRERVCAFRDHVHSLQSVRHPLRSKWYVDYSDGTRPFGLDIHG